MAWSTPRIWAAAELVTAANMNTYLSDDLAVLRAGGIAIASQAAGDIISASSSTQLSRLALGSARTALRVDPGGTVYTPYHVHQYPSTYIVSYEATGTPNCDVYAGYEQNAASGAIAMANPTGSPDNFQRLTVKLRDNGTSRAISWGTSYVSAGPALPSATTAASKQLTLLFIYSTTYAKWLLTGIALEP